MVFKCRRSPCHYDSISRFFVEYSKLQGKTFRVIGVEGIRSAMATVQKGIAAAKK